MPSSRQVLKIATNRKSSLLPLSRLLSIHPGDPDNRDDQAADMGAD